MAQKKTNSTTTKKTSAGSKSSKNTKASAAQTPQKNRHSRGTSVLIFFILGMFSLLGYFNNDGIIIKFFRNLMSGVLGGGFYLLPPALLACAVIFAVSRERPKGIRIVSIVCIPVLLGCFCQLFSKNSYELTGEVFKLLWTDGLALSGGGALAGLIETVFEVLFSKIGSFIVLFCVSVAAIFCATGVTAQSAVEFIKGRMEKRREERRYAEPEEQEAPKQDEAKPVTGKTKRKSNIDIPMDTDATQQEPPEKKEKKPLFTKKSADELLKAAEANNQKVTEPAPSTEEAPSEETVSVPEPEPKPVTEEPKAETVIPAIEKISEPEAPQQKADVIPLKPVYVRPNTPVPIEPELTFSKEKINAAAEGASFAQLVEESAKADEQKPAYQFPPISLLAAPKAGKADAKEELNATKERLERTLHSFGVDVEITNIINGPSVTRYEMELQIGVKLNKITNLADDIALALGVGGVRIAAVPNKISTVGIEVPNRNVSTVYLREIISSPEFRNASSKLTFAIGKNIGGEVMTGNISKLPHLLVAGTTGSGKSVCLNSLILSLMYKSTPDEVKFIMVDPKMVEFKIYNGIPHLLVPVVTEAKKAAGALQWAVAEMMKRYRLFSDVDAREISGYNERMKANNQPTIPFIVVIIDELADLMMVAAKEVEESICRIAQMGRAAGVHLVIATQSPRADVITGLMKANIPSRIAFKVASGLESRIILDAGGSADALMGNGDMLFAPIGTSKPNRIQGTWVSDEEREKIVEFVKSTGEANYSDEVISEIEKAASKDDKGSGGRNDAVQEDKGKDYDDLLPQAVDVIFESKQASVSMLQRRLKLGYARAARLVDQMEELGVVGPFEGSKPRQILITRQQWQEMQFINGTAPIEKPAEAAAPAVSEAPTAPNAQNTQNTFLEDLFPEDSEES